jgi:hypothetical protein
VNVMNYVLLSLSIKVGRGLLSKKNKLRRDLDMAGAKAGLDKLLFSLHIKGFLLQLNYALNMYCLYADIQVMFIQFFVTLIHSHSDIFNSQRIDNGNFSIVFKALNRIITL